MNLAVKKCMHHALMFGKQKFDPFGEFSELLILLLLLVVDLTIGHFDWEQKHDSNVTFGHRIITWICIDFPCIFVHIIFLSGFLLSNNFINPAPFQRPSIHPSRRRGSRRNVMIRWDCVVKQESISAMVRRGSVRQTIFGRISSTLTGSKGSMYIYIYREREYMVIIIFTYMKTIHINHSCKY